MKSLFTPKRTATALILMVFIADYFIPLGVSVGVLYLVSLPILLLEKKQTVLSFAVFIAVLILLNLWIFANGQTPSHIYINRFLSIFSVIIISYVLIRYKILKEKKEAIKEKQKKALEEMLFMTNHKVRHPIATLLGISEILKNSQFTAEEMNELIRLMQKPILDLDDFTKELTYFMDLQKRESDKIDF